MTAETADVPIWIIRPETVRRALRALIETPIHAFFPAYLLLRRKAIRDGSTTGLRVMWKQELAHLITVPGAPTGKTHLRPFMDDANPANAWSSDHMPGSWATSSVREGSPPLGVMIKNGRLWDLKEGHAALAREHLLYGTPVSAFSIAAFLYRDYGLLQTSDTPPDITNVVNGFFRDFEFVHEGGRTHPDLRVLFDVDSGDTWHDALEPWHPPADEDGSAP